MRHVCVLLLSVFADMIDILSEDILNLHDESVMSSTPSHYAAEAGNIEVLKAFILSSKVDATREDFDNQTPYHIACRRKDEDMITFLKKCAQDENIQYNLPQPEEKCHIMLLILSNNLK